ncbi:HTH_Tnp_Tc3_2 domain-containing protein [Trichonephila clavipes]|nr:HTH_Tnp_Tc3_2 domain-containing protein [Trichonephila clavipes]
MALYRSPLTVTLWPSSFLKKYGPMNPPAHKAHQTLGFSRSAGLKAYQEYMDGIQQTNNRANCEGELVLTVRGERRHRRIVRSHRSQTLAQMTSQLNKGASRIVSKWTVKSSLHRMDFGSRRPMRVPLLNALH